MLGIAPFAAATAATAAAAAYPHCGALRSRSITCEIAADDAIKESLTVQLSLT
jgi:hypothetical protein